MRPEHPHAMCGFRCRLSWLRPLRRRWLLWILMLGVIVLVVTRFVALQQFVATLAHGRWPWILAAALLQGGYYTLYAALYQAGFATVGVASRVPELIPVLFASILAGTITPTGGLTSAAVLIEDAARREQPTARAAEGVLLVWVAGLTGAVPLLVTGLVYLRLRGALQPYQMVGALIFLLYTAGLTGVLFLAMWQPGRLRHLLRAFQRTANRLATRLRRPPLLPEDWARKNAAESTGAAIAIARHPRKVARTLALALAVHLANLVSLYLIFLAFDRPPTAGALAAGFSLGYAFSVISIIPFDLGLVEGIMTIVYTSLGVPAASALVVTLAFRGLNAWLPVILSFALLRLVWRRRGRQ